MKKRRGAKEAGKATGKTTGKVRIGPALFLLVACSVGLVGIFGIFSFQRSVARYDETIYDLAYESLSLYIANVENELSNIEEHSYSVATNNTLQAFLKTANSGGAEGRTVYLNTVSLLAAIGFIGDYTAAAAVLDTPGTLYLQGNPLLLSATAAQHIAEAAAVAEGGHLILPPSNEVPCILSARQIRRMEHVGLDPYGTLILCIDPGALAQYTARFAGRYTGKLSIYAGTQPVLEAESFDLSGELLRVQRDTGADRGYFIADTPGGRRFVVYGTSAQTGWTYVNALSYDEMFQELNAIRRASILLYVVALVVAVALAAVIARLISRPIASLSAVMGRVQRGDFQLVPEEEYTGGTFREIRQLWRDYAFMMETIDTLINENYKKQLLLKETQLRWLEAQINPHFLYNTLESINWMARVDGHQDIADMAKSLGQLMRSAVRRDMGGTIALWEELELLEDYLRIQTIRHRDRLVVDIDVEPDALEASIPRLTLQPLVENSVSYALERVPGVCRIRVAAMCREERLVLTVTDNGPGIPQALIPGILDGTAKTAGSGLGIRNIYQRIRLLYGGAGALGLENLPQGGLQVRITLPMEGEADV